MNTAMRSATRAVMRGQRTGAGALANVQKRTAFIELVSTQVTVSLFAALVATLFINMPRTYQTRSHYWESSMKLPLYLAYEEKRNIMQLSKQLDNTATKWDRLPSAGAFRSASTRL